MNNKIIKTRHLVDYDIKLLRGNLQIFCEIHWLSIRSDGTLKDCSLRKNIR